ncbi:Eco57I restriction-modification methylase domain-containing protein [Lancefieldella rimae]|uniref:Eco57I restriction-modification methylase domain-containing protein n=1 Tax=Lancefieldella rimae TaxID=1383 RepID=UPI003A8EF900
MQHTIGSGFIESFDSRYPTRILETLLQDRTTGRNIIWADNEYEALGEGYMGDDEITVDKITGLSSGVIKPRIAKEQEHQSKRTKSRAEVFTPSWLCNQMNNDIDAVWFNRRDVFNIEDNQAWHTGQEPIIFPKKKGHGWHAYIESPRLEITCGEAPFVCSRYDTVTGETLPVDKRIGFLDRKLRVVSEKTKTRKEWVRWAFAALKASYGFEYQGDNLLLARINVFETFCEHLYERWGVGVSDEEIDQVAWIVSWNFWQMNGLTCAVPTNKMDTIIQSAFFEYKEPIPEPVQPTIFDLLNDPSLDESIGKTKMDISEEMVPFCVIYNWKENKPFEFVSLKGKAYPMDKKFYAVIGNPPYQIEGAGNKTFAPPIYHEFMDAAYEIGEKVELVTPARFLFNAGSTPKPWNQKMLKDRHFKVEYYEADASRMFPGTDIKGGVAITYRDESQNFGAIGTFTAFTELDSILRKTERHNFVGLDSIVTNRGVYRFSQIVYDEEPEEMKKVTDSRILSGAFERFPRFFIKNKPNDGYEYILIFGKYEGQRVYRWIRKDYVKANSNLEKYKVMVPKANGSGALGEVLSTPLIGKPLIGKPLIGFTETFISIGEVNTSSEAEAILKYVKSKFARTMLGILKITQDNTRPVWRLVPLQDFTSTSDIDWSKSIPEIDQQLYAKYGLSQEEIDFIESHVKEMN